MPHTAAVVATATPPDLGHPGSWPPNRSAPANPRWRVPIRGRSGSGARARGGAADERCDVAGPTLPSGRTPRSGLTVTTGP